jgi:hypothetical protein
MTLQTEISSQLFSAAGVQILVRFKILNTLIIFIYLWTKGLSAFKLHVIILPLLMIYYPWHITLHVTH